MVVAALSDNPDAFSLVLLSTLGKGQSIAATDMGWKPESGAFSAYSSESFSVVHTASDDEPPGTVLTQADFGDDPATSGWNPALSLSDYRDQLLVYQGAESDPTFLCAFDWTGSDWKTYDSELSSDYYSGLPKGLTNGVDALNPYSQGWSSMHYDNWAYKGTASADIDALREAFVDGSNWESSSTRSTVAAYVKTAFTVMPNPPSAPPPPAPLTCGPNTEIDGASRQCVISCPSRRRNLESASAGQPSAAQSVVEAFLLRHPDAADDFWQMQRMLSKDDGPDFRQPASA